MVFLKNFTQKHYNTYIDNIEPFVNSHTNIDQWVKNFTDKELNIWMSTVKLFENDSDDYYEEFSILLTILINFFIMELNIDDGNIKLNNAEILKLVNTFKRILYIEYSNRNKINKHIKEEYVLLK